MQKLPVQSLWVIIENRNNMLLKTVTICDTFQNSPTPRHIFENWKYIFSFDFFNLFFQLVRLSQLSGNSKRITNCYGFSSQIVTVLHALHQIGQRRWKHRTSWVGLRYHIFYTHKWDTWDSVVSHSQRLNDECGIVTICYGFLKQWLDPMQGVEGTQTWCSFDKREVLLSGTEWCIHSRKSFSMLVDEVSMFKLENDGWVDKNCNEGLSMMTFGLSQPQLCISKQ